MLQELHVKNLALIEEAEIDFTKGLNILTGETGAGKSLLIGSVQLALGGKVSKELIGNYGDYALVELIFQVERDREIEKLKELDLFPEDGQLILSRKITDGKSVNKINGESVTAAVLREAASVLLDLHGQHEHQSLLHKKNHLEILDAYLGEEGALLKGRVESIYREYKYLTKKLAESSMDEATRKKEADFLAFEVREIEEARLTEGEDEELELQYARMSNAKNITESLVTVHQETGYEESLAAGERVGRALRELGSVVSYDPKLRDLSEQLGEIDALLNDFNRELSDYLSSLEFEEEDYAEVEERLNRINHLKAKYGKTIPEVLAYGAASSKRLEELSNYDFYLQELEREVHTARRKLEECAKELSDLRRHKSNILSEQIREHLVDLNFLDVRFEISVEQTEEISSTGWDEVEFCISTNPGEPLKALGKVASGGELSRIMLAIKTVLADQEDVATVVFDEIDVGISGRTAQKVSEKMALIGKSRQVICITHLAQIAAMADSHFVIEKQQSGQRTRTTVERLSSEQCITELARILGGAEITETVMESAREMKKLAEAKKC